MKILFLFPYPHSTAASQRFRFEQYLGFLRHEGHTYSLSSFLDEATWQILYTKGFVLRKTTGIIKGFLRRFALLFSIPQYDFIFIHREAAPIGPPVIEWVIAKIFRKKIIFDFDDAIWLPNTSAHNRIVSGLKWHSKTATICRWAYKVSAGNKYLADYARQFNANVIVNPTTIDTIHLHSRVKDQHTAQFIIGWTGTHSTIEYLYELIPVLQDLEKQYTFTCLIISDKEPDFNLASLKYIPWNKETEIIDLLQFNIGLMPLTDDQWANGKCGFKALQYMSLGIPALVSPVGVNTEIVDNYINGYLCNSADDWKNNIIDLLKDISLRLKMGKAARKKVEEAYSVQANRRIFLDFFTA